MKIVDQAQIKKTKKKIVAYRVPNKVYKYYNYLFKQHCFKSAEIFLAIIDKIIIKDSLYLTRGFRSKIESKINYSSKVI